VLLFIRFSAIGVLFKGPIMEQILVTVKDLKKYYHAEGDVIKALNGVTLDIMQGEIIGLLGVNGAGKTTLSSILATLHPPTSGEILVHGKSIYANICEYRRIIGFCPQKVNLDNDLTVAQNLTYAGRYMGVPESILHERLEYFMHLYDFERYMKNLPDVLSGGYARRVLIARSLMHKPRMLILDEPTVGLDPYIRHQLWETIRDLKKEGVTIILTTHYLDEAEFLSDRICVLDKGKVRLLDTPEGLKTAYQKSRLEEVFIQLISEDTQQ